MTNPTPSPKPDAPQVGLLQNRNFVLLWLACGISALGGRLSELAALGSLGAADHPDSTALMARMTLCFMLPFFLLGPVAGWLADRWPRKWIMVTADSARAVLLLVFAGLMAAFEDWGPWGRFLPLVMVGIFAAGFSPARSALLPVLIRPDQLVRANALTGGLGMVAAMLGFYFGGLLAGHYPSAAWFRVDAGTFVVSAALLLMVRPPGGRRRGETPARRRGQLRRGFSYVLGHKRVLQLIGFAVVFWWAGAVLGSVLPAVVAGGYGPDYGTVGLYQAAAGCGFVLGALVLAAFGDALREHIAITWSMLGAGTATSVLAATILWPPAPGASAALGLLACAALGMFGAGILTGCNALLQRIVPDRYRGRVFGIGDMATVAGLLGATGLLAVPGRPDLNSWAGHLLAGVAVVLTGGGLLSLGVRWSRSPFGLVTGFLYNLNEFYCRWWFHLRREGPCTVPRRGPVIVAANHTVSIDPLLLLASCPHRLIGFMTATEYYHLPVVQYLLRRIDAIPVNRDGRDLPSTRRALQHLREGRILGIFPEGRIAAPGLELEPKKGVALLALRSGAVIVPACISGTRWSGSAARPFFRRHQARVRYGRPIDLSAYRKLPFSRDVQRQVARLVMERIRELSSSPS